jgi:hypothetical protein
MHTCSRFSQHLHGNAKEEFTVHNKLSTIYYSYFIISKHPRENNVRQKTIKTNKYHNYIRFKACVATKYNENFSGNQPCENGVHIQCLGN